MDEQLEYEEKWIILQALKCLHNLKYISDLAIISDKNHKLLETLVEEVVKVKEVLHGKKSD